MIFVGKLQRCLDLCNHSYSFNRSDRHKSTAPLLSEQCPGIHCTPPPSCPLPRPGAKLPCSSQISTDRMWTPSIHPPALHRPGQRGSYYTDSPVLICHHYPPCLSLYTGPGAGLIWGQCRHCHCHGYFEFVINMGGRQGNMT